MIILVKKIAGLVFLGLLTACTVGPDYRTPAVASTHAFKELKGWKPARAIEPVIPEQWWRLFNDGYLDKLETQVSVSNQSIAQAEAQFRNAQSLVQTATAAYFPTANGTATANRFRAATGQSIAVSGIRNLFAAGLSATWEPDLWGSVRRQVESAEATAQASAATLQALRLSTQATLAQNYFQLRALDKRIKLLNDTVYADEKALKVTQNRYSVGVSAKTDVIQAEVQLNSTRAQAINLEIQRAKFEHAIAILIGKSPAEISIVPTDLNLSPPEIPVSIPSQLLERRPDIAAAERQAAAANAQIGVAKAAYFPTVSLSASKGTQSSTFATLLAAGARYWALGPAALVIPLFDGGARGAQMQQTIDAYDASVAAYRQAVLASFQEVEDQLAALRLLKQELIVQHKAVDAARKTVSIVTNQYQAGLVSYLDVIIAQTTARTNEMLAVDLQGQQMVAAVLLIKALGGGWHLSSLPSQDDIGGKAKWSQFLPIPLQ